VNRQGVYFEIRKKGKKAHPDSNGSQMNDPKLTNKHDIPIKTREDNLPVERGE
jgi:hypothetical protein